MRVSDKPYPPDRLWDQPYAILGDLDGYGSALPINGAQLLDEEKPAAAKEENIATEGFVRITANLSGGVITRLYPAPGRWAWHGSYAVYESG